MQLFKKFLFSFTLVVITSIASTEAYTELTFNENANVTVNQNQLSATLIDTLTTPGLCHGATDGTIYFIVDAGGLPFTVSNNWSVQSDTVFLDSLTPGNYSTLIEDSIGDTLTFNYTIADYPVPHVSIDYANSFLTDCGWPNNAHVIANITGGTPPFNIDPFSQFSLIDSTITGSGLLFGNQPYSTYITDSNNCSCDLYVWLDDRLVFYAGLVTGPYCAGINGTEVTIHCYYDEFDHAVGVSGISNYLINDDLILLNNVAPGNYSVVVYDLSGCPYPVNFIVGQSNLQLNTTVNNTTCIGCDNGEIILNASGYNNFYSASITPNFPITGDTIINLPAGIYDVCITDSLNCNLCVSDTVFEDPTFVSSFSTKKINIYPNPVSQIGAIIFQFPLTDTELCFFTESGKKLKIDYRAEGTKLIFDTGNLPNGIYFVQILQQNKLTDTLKFIVEK
jgi:hypothetical protein